MARLIPKVSPAAIQNSGERIVAQALAEQLPPDCRIYHSYPWLRVGQHPTTGRDVLQPGEADFVIVDPTLGVLILEVKGGTIEYEPDTHLWRRLETGEPIKDPFAQAERNKYALRDRIAAHPVFFNSGPQGFTLGHAVVFPDCRFAGALPANAARDILLDADDLPEMKKAIARAYDAWCAVDHPHRLDDARLDAIVEALSPVFRFTPVLWRTLDQQEERIKRLTDEQLHLLEFLSNQQRAAIEGVAGSGKTILAMAQAQRFAREGQRTLLLCYNRLLAEWLDNQLPEQYRRSITCSSYHSLVREMCRKTRLPFPASSYNQEFWDFEAPELLEQATDLVGDDDLYDTVVVDEGQDFLELWWIGLEKLFRKASNSKPMYVFYDPKQVIYQAQTAIPLALGNPYVLSLNCRNTRRIASFCAEIMDIQIPTHTESPDGIDPKVHHCRTMSEVIRKSQQIVQDWCLGERGGLAPQQVAILTDSTRPNSWPTRIGNIPLVQDQMAWRAGGGVLLDTYRRFKGLEADAIVLAGVPPVGTDDKYTRHDHYVATSRAKHLLEIVYHG